MSHALHNRPGIRFHAAKYNVDTAARKRLKMALKTLAEHEEAIDIALRELKPIGTVTVQEVLGAALRLLVYGEKGEFR